MFVLPLKSSPSSDKSSITANQDDEIIYKLRSEKSIRLISIPNKQDFVAILTSLKNSAPVEFAEENYRYLSSIIPSDSNFNSQWYLKKIKATTAWNSRNDSPEIVIAVIDSGIDINHPDLMNNIWVNKGEKPNNGRDDDGNGFIDDLNGWDFVSKTADPRPKFDKDWNLDGIMHGTVVAGIIAASGNNATGVTGVTWRARLMPLRVLDGRGQGRANDVIKAIDYAVANGADLINLSFNGFDYSQGMNEAIKRAYDAGVIVVAAAGNELSAGKGYNLSEDPMYPVCLDGPRNENWIIGVAATDVLDQKTAFSSFGFNCVDLAAPGVSIYSTSVYAPDKQINNKNLNVYYDGFWSGTSVAAPQVTGALALIEAANPRSSRNEVIKFLLDGTDNISRLNPDYLGQLGRGRLNIEASVNIALADFKNYTAKLLFVPASGNTDTLTMSDSDGNNLLKITIPEIKQNGIQITAGDVEGDGQASIITAPGSDSEPIVRIYNLSGKLQTQFYAYNKNFRGGVKVAAGDINNDGKAEIITGPGPGGGPHVKVFDAKGMVKLQFFAYDKNFRGGVNVAAGDIDSKIANRQAEIITGPGPGGGPHVKVFDRSGLIRAQFFVFDKKFKGGLSVAVADVNQDSKVEIIAAAGPGGGPHIRTFDLNGKLLDSFYGMPESFRGGINVSVIEN